MRVRDSSVCFFLFSWQFSVPVILLEKVDFNFLKVPVTKNPKFCQWKWVFCPSQKKKPVENEKWSWQISGILRNCPWQVSGHLVTNFWWHGLLVTQRTWWQGHMVSKSIGDSDIWWQNIAGDKDTWWRNLAGTGGLISLIYQSFRFQHNSRKANIWIFTSFHVASTAISNLYDCIFYLVENLQQGILIFDTKG